MRSQESDLERWREVAFVLVSPAATPFKFSGREQEQLWPHEVETSGQPDRLLGVVQALFASRQ